MQGLWLFYSGGRFFFFHFSFLFESVAGVWTCEGILTVCFKGLRVKDDILPLFLTAYHFSFSLFPESSSFRYYILMSANSRALFVFLSLCPPLGIKGAVVSRRERW